MTDLEKTKLCAEAMGYEVARLKFQPHTQVWISTPDGMDHTRYDPLHDDAQAMALVKRFRLDIENSSNASWLVVDREEQIAHAEGECLNRAIVECVAKMQAARAQRETA